MRRDRVVDHCSPTTKGRKRLGVRLMLINWVMNIREQCQRANVAFFFMRWRGVQKKRNGRALEGRTWRRRNFSLFLLAERKSFAFPIALLNIPAAMPPISNRFLDDRSTKALLQLNVQPIDGRSKTCTQTDQRPIQPEPDYDECIQAFA